MKDGTFTIAVVRSELRLVVTFLGQERNTWPVFCLKPFRSNRCRSKGAGDSL